MNLNNRFIDFLTHKTDAALSSRFLLAVSGGVDSMVMAHLFLKAGLTFSVAHCNFSLRGEDSNLDQQLVTNFCKDFGITFYEKVFDTRRIMREERTGLQETARNLRYNWFNELKTTHHYDYIVTAHHKDDNAETVLFNIIRGTGLKGLRGIPVHQNAVIRPLLFAEKETLYNYAQEHNLSYREDVSNESNAYSRNKIRNKILPVIKEINPEALDHIRSLTEISEAASSIINDHIQLLRTTISEQHNDQIKLHCEHIIRQPHSEFFLYELLSEFGVNKSQVSDINQLLKNASSGSYFMTETHRVLVNRTELIIQQTDDKSPSEIRLEKWENCTFNIGGDHYEMQLHEASGNTEFKEGSLYLDADILVFPLSLRRWIPGDLFTPLGMKGKKKISDFLIDKKVSVPDKENTCLLISDGVVAAVINHQIDHKFRMTPRTKRILRITKKEESDN